MSLVTRSSFLRITSRKLSQRLTQSSVDIIQIPQMSKIISIQANGVVVPKGISRNASKILKDGLVIATPTDTIYGIAALVQNNDSVERLYQIKKRDPKKPIAICVAEIEDLIKWSHVTVPDALLHELLPGPVTVVFERKQTLNPAFNPDTRLIGIRIPDHKFIREVCSYVNSPLALTSANISSAQSTLSVDEFQELYPHLHSVFDGGRLGNTEEARLGSTVVDLSVKGHYKIIRAGSAFENTTKVLEKFELTKAE